MFIGLIVFAACKQNRPRLSARSTQLQDTIAKLRIKADFRPLDSAEAYDFLNKVYLPGLDTKPTKRKLFIHPLSDRNYKEIFENDARLLKAKFNHDTSDIKSAIILPPPSITFDKQSRWNLHRLVKTVLITDDDLMTFGGGNKSLTISQIKKWHQKFGYGYMCVSYPLYNKQTNRLLLCEWIENASWCGTGRDNSFWFKKTTRGWKKY